MNLGLEGKVALVTAASKGIGLGTAKILAQEGCKVAICSRSKDDLERAQSIIAQSSARDKVLALQADLTSEKDIESILSETRRRFGDIDILAYNTGSPKVSSFMDLSNQDWETGVKLLLMSAVWLSKGVIPAMKEKRWQADLHHVDDAKAAH
jgi:3-oxoacyl-[acyl-carrier protein] reductase